MYFLYSLLTALAMLLLLPFFLFRGLRTGKYLHNIRERLGYLPASLAVSSGHDGNATGAIWLHAVSVGEVLAALPLARQLRERFPAHRLLLSTTTLTGQTLARERVDFTDGVFYFPLDWAGPVRRVLRALRPTMVVMMETEIWPNFLRECRRAHVPVIFVSGRISQRSFRQYRWLQKFIPGFIQRVMSDPTAFLMQSEADAERVMALGAPAERVTVGGNLKYDLLPPASGPFVSWLEEQITRQERWPLVVAGSILEGEGEAVLAAFDLVQRRWRRALLVVAPRKPEWFDDAARSIVEDGWNLVRRSSLGPDSSLAEDADAILLDSIGELGGLYRLADAVFVGGSLVPAGGHNILEPAWFARPPVFGASMDNFQDMARQFLEAMAGYQVRDARELGRRWIHLIENESGRQQMGEAARQIVERNRGAAQRAAVRITEIVAGSGNPG